MNETLRRQILDYDADLPLERAHTIPAGWYFDPDLAEQSFGEWQGLTYVEIAEKHANNHLFWLGPPEYRPPGGESFVDLAQVRHRAADRQGLRVVVLSLEESPDLDGTVLESLGDFAAWLDTRGIVLRVARLKDAAREALERMALPQLPPQALDYWSVEDAVLASSPAEAKETNA